MRVWRSAKSGEAEWDGLHRIVSLSFFVACVASLHIARSMPVFDSPCTLIFKGFLLTGRRENPCFRNSGIGPSDHPDGIRVIPETLYLRAFPRFWERWDGVRQSHAFRAIGGVPKRKNPRFRGFFRTSQARGRFTSRQPDLRREPVDPRDSSTAPWRRQPRA